MRKRGGCKKTVSCENGGKRAGKCAISIYVRSDRRLESRVTGKDGKRRSFYGYTQREVKRKVYGFIAEEFKDAGPDANAPENCLQAGAGNGPESGSEDHSDSGSKSCPQDHSGDNKTHGSDNRDAIKNIGISGKVADLAEKWLDVITKARYTKESSISIYSTNIRLYIVSKFGDRNIEDLTVEECDDFFRNLLAFGRRIALNGHDAGSQSRPLKRNTVNGAIRLLNVLIAFSVDLGFHPQIGRLSLIKKEARVESASPVSSDTGGENVDKSRILTAEEKNRLEAFIKDHPDRINLGVLLTMYTGIRIGELCGLKWKDIDLKNKTIKITHTLQRIPNRKNGGTKVIFTPPKSRTSVRTIPLIDDVAEVIRLYYEDWEKLSPEAFFLTGESGKFIEPRNMENKFAKLLNDAGIDRIRFHSLRHGFSTFCIESGMDVKSVCEILGHSTPTITLSMYTHPSLEHKREGLNRIFGKNAA